MESMQNKFKKLTNTFVHLYGVKNLGYGHYNKMFNHNIFILY